jgi:hypothetical protein
MAHHLCRILEPLDLIIEEATPYIQQTRTPQTHTNFRHWQRTVVHPRKSGQALTTHTEVLLLLRGQSQELCDM